MLNSSVLDLRRSRTWDPTRLAAESFHWPTDLPLVAIDAVTSRLHGTVSPSEGSIVITPGGIDTRSGAIRRRSNKYLGEVFQVGGGEGTLRPGDLLIPPRPDTPVLYVHEGLIGSLASTSFAALRPTEGAYWIWGVLNSTSGMRLRSLMATGASGYGRAAVAGLAIPWATVERRNILEPSLRALEQSTHSDEAEVPTSWWRTANLTQVEWRFALASPTPEVVHKGFPLEALTDSIRRGIHSATESANDTKQAGYVPVADSAWLRTGIVHKWCSPDGRQADLRTSESDVVIARIGSVAYARVAPGGYVLGSTVYSLTLKDPALADGLVNYLNSRTGRGMRELRLTGMVVPELRLSDLRALRVTEQVFQAPSAEVERDATIPLSERLERVLWT